MGILGLFQIMYTIHFVVDVLYMHLIFYYFFVIFGGYFAFAIADNVKAI
jgi:hypothetical protein